MKVASRPGIATATGSSSTSSPTLRSAVRNSGSSNSSQVVVEADRRPVALAVAGEGEVDAQQQRPQPQHHDDQDGRSHQDVGREALGAAPRAADAARAAVGARSACAVAAAGPPGAEPGGPTADEPPIGTRSARLVGGGQLLHRLVDGDRSARGAAGTAVPSGPWVLDDSATCSAGLPVLISEHDRGRRPGRACDTSIVVSDAIAPASA